MGRSERHGPAVTSPASAPDENRPELRAGEGPVVRLADLVFAVADAMDAMCPAVAAHHRRVACVADAIAARLGLPPDERRDVVLAAALHDGGAFSLRTRIDLLDFEVAAPHQHAEAGYRLLRGFRDFVRPALLVRHHHVAWHGGRGAAQEPDAVRRGSQVVHLADRVAVLIRPGSDPEGQAPGIRRRVAARAGSHFVPEQVAAFEEAASSPGFWAAAAAPPARAHEALLGDAAVPPADLKALCRLFWQLVDFRSRFTATHTSGVAAVADHLGGLCGLDGATTRKLSLAAGLHDLGKLSVPVEILEKPGPLSAPEWVVMRRHPACGFRVLEDIPAFADINRWANYHHERLNGTGYPFRLAAKRLPLESRIVSVADVFTALTEDRPYRRGLSGREATAILRDMAGEGALDPGIVSVAGRDGDDANAVRRLAQERARERYGVFRERGRPHPAALHPA